MRRPLAVWTAGIGTLVVLDIWADRNDTPGDSLSECVRLIYRPETALGRCAFIGSWLALTAWFLPHIINGVEQAVDFIDAS